MATVLKGASVANSIRDRASSMVSVLSERGIVPTLCIIRIGEKPDDLYYERNAEKQCAKVGIEVKKVTLPNDIDNSSFLSAVNEAASDQNIHGILLLRPVPSYLDESKALELIPYEKDVDGCTLASMARIYSDPSNCFAPCTAQAVIEILDYYGISVSQKKVTVLGRSLVSGKPAAMLLLARNATVTICHSKTIDPASISRESEILVTCTGIAQSVGNEYFNPNQTVIDVGICSTPDGGICGDLKYEDALNTVNAVTPVPGGVGSVTTSVLALHVAQAAELQSVFQKGE